MLDAGITTINKSGRTFETLDIAPKRAAHRHASLLQTALLHGRRTGSKLCPHEGEAPGAALLELQRPSHPSHKSADLWLRHLPSSLLLPANTGASSLEEASS